MAQKKIFYQRNLFIASRTKPRKATSRSPLKLSSEEFARDFGKEYQIIDVRIGDQKMILDIERGGWKFDDTTTNPQDITVLKQKIGELEEDNNILRTKLDILLTMLAETEAETQFKNKVDI